MGAGLHDERGARVTLGEAREALAGVGDRFLGEDGAGVIEDAHVMPAVPEV